MERLPLPSTVEAQELFLKKLNVPTVFQIPEGTWPHEQSWSPSGLARQCGDICTGFRVWSRHVKDEIVWENDCDFVYGSFAEFNEWLDSQRAGGEQLDDDNPFFSFQMEDVCVFAAYKYMHETFGEDSPLCRAVQWDMFGFEGRSGSQTTFWCGSEGAYTPCHFDSYGCNIVVQLHGRKRWTLFPPDQTEFLYSTRLPYEESSVFSEVNIARPDTEEHPLFKEAKPLQCMSTSSIAEHLYRDREAMSVSEGSKGFSFPGLTMHWKVVLHPGEALFVPKHWWHFVESLDTAVSVNTWIELESDCQDRLQEAITRTIVCAMKTGEDCSDWSTPTEIIEDHRTNLAFVHMALKEVKNMPNTAAAPEDGCQSDEEGDQPNAQDLSTLSSFLARVLTTPSTIAHISSLLLDKSQLS